MSATKVVGMEISVTEALAVLATLGDDVARTRGIAREATERRDAVIRELDGQPGMVRREMAEQLGMSKQALLVIAQRAAPERERVLDAIPMDEELYAQLVAVIGGFARSLKGAEAVKFDVHA